MSTPPPFRWERTGVWHPWCLICGRPLPRRWWQRGILRPLPLCPRRDAPACQAAADARR